MSSVFKHVELTPRIPISQVIVDLHTVIGITRLRMLFVNTNSSEQYNYVVISKTSLLNELV